ncbi:MAG: hypothetical protein IKK00_01750, partial [Oscillospiraceae bacterium]|nr:hypothetical protein [Oscillospiraceae bacterium]
MRMFKNAIRKSALVLVVLCLVLSLPMAVSAAEFGPRYNDQAAVSYAAAHWNDGVGVCDQFVKDCLKAGGVEILAGGVDPLRNALLDAGLGSATTLKISADGVHALKSENPSIQAGDILFFYCEECHKSIHTAIIAGYDENGYLYTYAHNPGWDKVDWIGSFAHGLEDGQKHRDCYQYLVVAMDRGNYSHTHNFTTGLYEAVHPHKMYAQCSCSARYYLGWNATVSTCTDCNPPSSEVPVVTAESDGTSITVRWTTVHGALEYQVWRARSKTGTYFNIYSAMSTWIVNKSVTAGETYYYKVVAVLGKDGNGNPTNTVSSEIVSCSLDSGLPAVPGTPSVTGKLNSSNKAVISWNTVSGAAKYEVWRSTSENGTYSRLITTTKLSCTNSPKADTYYYKVRAIDSNGNTGAYSNIVCVTVPGVVPVITGKLNASN